MDELCCEECGAIATRTIHGIDLCDDCEIGGDEDADSAAHWLNEVPSGLLDDDDDGDGDALFNDLG